MNFVAIWAGLPKWMRDALVWAGAIIAVVLFGKVYIESRKNEARKDERQKQEVETQKERARVIETSAIVIHEIEDAKDAALAAPDTVPVFESADELRAQAPAIASIILRNRPKDER